MKCDVIAERRHRGREASRPRACRSSCASKGPTSRRASRSWPRAELHDHRRPTISTTRRRRSSQAVAASEAQESRHEHSASTKTRKLIVQGITGERRHVPRRAGDRDYGTKMVGGVTPGKGGTTHRRLARSSTPCDEAVDKTGANATRDLRAAAVRRRRDHRSRRRGHRARRLRSPKASRSLDMVKRRRAPREPGTKSRLIGPNCPGVITPGAVQDRHHARLHPQARQRRRRLALRHADLRSRLAAHRASASARSPASASAAIRSTARTSSTCSTLFNDDPETEAIIMIGEIGGSAEEEAAEYIKKHVKKPVVGFIAGRTAPPGQAHGPRRRDHLRRQGHGAGEDRGAQGRGRARRAEPGADRRDDGEGARRAGLLAGAQR